MGIIPSTTAIRYTNYLDIYTSKRNTQLWHYYVNPQTNWQIMSEIIYTGVFSQICAIRYTDYIDLYFINTGYELVHMWTNPETGWVYRQEILWGNCNGLVKPFVLRYQNYIDVYFVDRNQNIVHLWTNQSTGWQHRNQIIKNGNNILSITGIRDSPNSLNIYVNDGGKLICANPSNNNKWQYKFFQLGHNISNQHKIQSTYYNNNIDIFYCDNNGNLRQIYAGQHTNWQYRTGASIGNGMVEANKFCVLRFQDNIDVYFVGQDDRVYHTYSGIYTNWNWMNCQVISEGLVGGFSGIGACRVMGSIDVFYVNQQEELENLFIGQGTNNDWSRYWCKTAFKFSDNQINWDQVRNKCHELGQGYHAKSYMYSELGVVLKVMKKPNPTAIIKQIKTLRALEPIWPDLWKHEVISGGRLVGFSVRYFPGVKWQRIVRKSNNMFTKFQAKARLILKLKSLITQFQKLKICHGDISFGNILIDIKNQQNYDFDVVILDFGNGFIYKEGDKVSQILTGWNHIKPPQSFHYPYNPDGVNAYQLGKLVLQILLHRHDRPYKYEDVNKQIQKVKALNISKQLLMFTQGLLHQTDIELRNKVLFNQLNPHTTYNISVRGVEDAFSMNALATKALQFLAITHPYIAFGCSFLFSFVTNLMSDPFEDIREKIEKLVNEKFQDDLKRRVKASIKVIKDNIDSVSSFLEDISLKSSLKSQKYVALQTAIALKMSQFTIEGYETILLPNFIAYAILYLGFLRLGVRSSNQLGWGQKQKQRYQKQLQHRIQACTDHIKSIKSTKQAEFNSKIDKLSNDYKIWSRKLNHPHAVSSRKDKLAMDIRVIEYQKKQFFKFYDQNFANFVQLLEKFEK